MSTKKDPLWVIGDIKHGKTYFFDTWEALTDWLRDIQHATLIKNLDDLVKLHSKG